MNCNIVDAYSSIPSNLQGCHEGTLPFTGFSIALILLIAVVLIAVGVYLRRASRR